MVTTAPLTKDRLFAFVSAKNPELKKTTTVAALMEMVTPEEIRELQVAAMTEAERKKGFYKMIAERVALPSDGENPMDRGNRLEHDAIATFAKQTGKLINTDLVVWLRDDNESIGLSPDGYVEGDKITEAVEIKCLASETHIEAYLTKKIPSDYQHQALQYFIVNDDLETLYFTFYDPRMPEKISLFWIEVTRKEVQEDVEMYLAFERKILAEVDEIVNELTF